MKRLLSLAALLLAMLPATAQTPDYVRAAEYFFDTDPGPGAGTALMLSLADDTVDLSASVVVPANMAPGEHSLYVRSYADTLGAGGRWSMARAAAFTVAANVVAAEYFFDTDPGVGLATPLPAFTADDSVNLVATISTAGLQPGMHTVHVRTRGNTGAWALVTIQQFHVADAVAAAEYFFDHDPGVGMATPWPASITADDSVVATAAVSTTGLSQGEHSLYVRTRSSTGSWSLAPSTPFYISNAVTAAEYFIDADPGAGMGIPLPAFPADDSIDQSWSVALPAGLPRGDHMLHVRTRSGTGAWSLTRAQSFFVKPRIAAAEYFWDTDPGVGAGTVLVIASPQDSVDVSYTVTAPCLSPGQHLLYLRTRDEGGVWGLARADTLTFSNPAVTITAEYPGPGPYGTPVKVAGSGGEAPYTFRAGAGAFTTDSVFLVSNGAAATFEVQDACGYSATTSITAPFTPPQIANGTRGGDTILSKGWRHWFYVLDSAGHIVGAVKDGGQSLGEVRFTFAKNPGTVVRQFGPGTNGNRPYLDRNWLLQTTNTPTAPVGVAFFATNSEFAALDAADPDPAFDNISDLYLTKYDGPNEDLTWSNNTGSNSQLLYPDSNTTHTGGGPAGYALWTHVSSFSEFYQNGNYSVPLAHRSLRLDAEKVAAGTRILWTCDDENGVARYTLQRQLGANGWKDLTTLSAGHGAYDFIDENLSAGTRYYRVRLGEESGAVHFSKTVAVHLQEATSVALSPNPVVETLRVSGLSAGCTLRILDAGGRVQRTLSTTEAVIRISMKDLPPGEYGLQVLAMDGTSRMFLFTRR